MAGAERKPRPGASGAGTLWASGAMEGSEGSNDWHPTPKAGQRAWTVPNRTAGRAGPRSWVSAEDWQAEEVSAPTTNGRGGAGSRTLWDTLSPKQMKNWSQAGFLLAEASGPVTGLLVLVGAAFPRGQEARHGAGGWQGPERVPGSGARTNAQLRVPGRCPAGGLPCGARGTDSAQDKWPLFSRGLSAFRFWPRPVWVAGRSWPVGRVRCQLELSVGPACEHQENAVSGPGSAGLGGLPAAPYLTRRTPAQKT